FCAGNIAIGLATLALLHADPALLLAIPPCLAVAFLGYRGYVRTIQERTIWQHFEAASQDINQLDETEIAEVALARAVALLEADSVELHLLPAYGIGVEQIFVGTAAGVTIAPVTPGRRHDDEPPPEPESAKTHIEIPLVAHDEPIGCLRVLFGSRVKLSD